MRISDWSSDVCSSDLSDSVLDALLAQDPESRVACETATTTGTVWVFGEVTTQAYVEIEDIVRKTVREIGYTDSAHGFDAETCGVISSNKGQSPDIAQGVKAAFERRESSSEDRTEERREGKERVSKWRYRWSAYV